MSTSKFVAGVISLQPSPERLQLVLEKLKREVFKAQDSIDRVAGTICVGDPAYGHWDYVSDQLAKSVCAIGTALQAAYTLEIEMRIAREADEVMKASDILLDPALADTPRGERPVQS